MAKVLGVLAIALAVVALAVNFVIPGPQGPAGTDGAQGSQGPQGPLGPTGPGGQNCWDLNGNGIRDVGTEDLNGDTVVDVADCRGATGPSGSGALVTSAVASPWQTGGLGLVGCTNVLTLSLVVPSAGTLVLTSTVHVWVDHTNGVTDTWTIFHGDTPTMCSDTATDRGAFFQEISGAAPTDTFMNEAGTLVNAFPAAGAGTYTYYVNAEMYAGESANDRVSEASAVLVFYPA
ncbi:MAG TPA: hypothetical protein VGR51_03265 [Thermoplasmata archaeon]|nr:hypothetical protein [Thermoplasmata archaeon]